MGRPGGDGVDVAPVGLLLRALLGAPVDLRGGREEPVLLLARAETAESGLAGRFWFSAFNHGVQISSRDDTTCMIVRN
jgi:hypothetical protein